ncbi:MAG: hypothetical protein J6R85_00710, partial [Lentisphaeria bacterium]|nr:hypothetical protein [Lentisphaeria bacterium]
MRSFFCFCCLFLPLPCFSRQRCPIAVCGLYSRFVANVESAALMTAQRILMAKQAADLPQSGRSALPSFIVCHAVS